MPIDPSIPLSVRPPTPGMNPLELMMQGEQLQSMQQQRQLRQLQAAQLGQQFQQQQGLTAATAKFAQGQAAPAQLPPGQTPAQLAQPMAGGAEATAIADTPMALPGSEAAPHSPQPDARATSAPVASPETPGRPNDPMSYAAISKKHAFYQDMMQQFPLAAGPWVERAIASDQHTMSMRKMALEESANEWTMMSQMASGVAARPEAERPAALQQMRALAMRLGRPNADQIPTTWDAHAADWVTTMSEQALSQKERLEFAIKRHEAETKRYEADIKARELFKPTSTGAGVMMEPRPGTGTMVPVTTPGGQLVPTLEAAQAGPVVIGPNGEPMRTQASVPPGTIPTAVPLQPVGGTPGAAAPAGVSPQTIPGYNRPVPNTLGGASVAPLRTEGQLTIEAQRLQQMREPKVAVEKERLSQAQGQAEQARSTHNILDEMKQITHEGYYDASPLIAGKLAGIPLPSALKVYKESGVVTPGYDAQKLARTVQLQNLAQNLVVAEQGGRGLRVGPTEIETLKQAAGGGDKPQPRAVTLGMIDRLRRLGNQQLGYANEVSSQYGSLNPQGQAGTTPSYPVKQTISAAQFGTLYDKVVKERAAKQLPPLTSEAYALILEKAGYHVQSKE